VLIGLTPDSVGLHLWPLMCQSETARKDVALNVHPLHKKAILAEKATDAVSNEFGVVKPIQLSAMRIFSTNGRFGMLRDRLERVRFEGGSECGSGALVREQD